MSKGRLEAFSDGIIAVIVTIMVLDLRPPHAMNPESLRPLVPSFFSYVLSFIFTGIYWNNHHHLFQAVERVNGDILWANLHLLFWLSLIPFFTAWMGENFGRYSAAFYGGDLLLSAIAYYILTHRLIKTQGIHSRLAKAIGSDLKGKISIVIYVAAIPSAFLNPWLSVALYVLVAAMWLIPDRRIERSLNS